MVLTAGMVASEILVCGVKAGIKSIPGGGMVVEVIEGLQKRHEAMGNAARMAELQAQMSRTEKAMRDTVEKEIRTILGNLSQPSVPGPEMTREMAELRQIYEQGWVPNLFEGILRNSSHLGELRRNPATFGRILRNDEKVDPASGMMHLLIDKDMTRILEVPAASMALLLSNQAVGVPSAEVKAGQDIWAFPSSKERRADNYVPEGKPLFRTDLGCDPLPDELLFTYAGGTFNDTNYNDPPKECSFHLTNRRIHLSHHAGSWGWLWSRLPIQCLASSRARIDSGYVLIELKNRVSVNAYGCDTRANQFRNAAKIRCRKSRRFYEACRMAAS